MKRYGLIGFPLSHSFSKKFFTEKFEKEGIAGCVYENFSIPSIDEVPSLLEKFPDLEGFNVTIPYKQQVIPFLHESNTVVRETGACNCVRISNGKLYGYNTDVAGFKRSLQPKLKSHHQRALILGKGGAAKAVAYVLKSLAIDFMFVVRKDSGEPDTIGYEAVDAELLRTHQLIINTTPLGTYPDTAAAPPLPYGELSPYHYLYDLVYNPPKTLFLQLGEEQGATIQNGADMLVIQAEESWSIWNQ